MKINELIIDLTQLPQFAEKGQIIAAFYGILYCRDHLVNDALTLQQVIKSLFNKIEKNGLECINFDRRPDLALPRPFEVAAIFNRIPGIEFKEKLHK